MSSEYTLHILQVTKSSSVTILIICVYALSRNKHAKLYFLARFKPEI